MLSLPRIYAIADQEAHGGERLPEVAHTLAEAGVRWIQLRIKQASDAETYRWAEACARRLEGAPSVLWIDDRADVAALLGAFGVHVGQNDLPPEAVRRVVGTTMKIGRSTHSEEQLREAEADPDVDVVALGPIFATRSKRARGGAVPDPEVGVDLVRRTRTWRLKPLVAIGGIGAANLGRVLEAGADAVAMIAALGNVSSSLSEISRNARRLLAAAA